jgi:hypothetical protein
MTTRDTVTHYLDRLRAEGDWESSFADDIVFTSRTSPARRLTGRAAVVQGTKRFYSMVVSMELRELIVDGSRACALTHYELQAPGGAPPFGSDVAEVFVVANDRIQSFDIYFDRAPYPR